MSQYIINLSSKMCFYFTLIYYGKPMIRVYGMVENYVHASLARACLVIFINREKLLQLLVWCGSGSLKGILHPKIKILSSFTHPQVVSNLYEFLSSVEHK